MDPQSPPKRMTRARAAAKASETGPKTTKIVTAAAKAKAAPASTRATASTKRKTRSDEVDHEDDEGQEHNEAPEPATRTRATRAARGRPKKDDADADELSAPAPAPGRATRARAAARKTATDAPKPEPSKAEPVKATRGRPKKTQATAPVEQAEAPLQPAKKATRGRPTGNTTTTRPAVKKKVTFEEPEKENVIPDAPKDDGKGSSATGLRARPVRKPPVPRATRAAKSSATASKEAKTPLSPKKVTQMPHARDTSEDELTAIDKTPVKPMMQSPTKPPPSALGSLYKPKSQSTETESAPEVKIDEAEPQQAPEVILPSPAKRPPSSPYKDSLKSPAKRVEGVSLPMPVSPTKQPSDGQATPFKTSMLNSPAKRPQSAIKGLTLPSTNRAEGDESKSPMKASLLNSPAKRPALPLKGFPTPKQPDTAVETQQLAVHAAETQAEPSDASKSLTRPSVSNLPSIIKTSSEKLMFEEQGDNAMDQLADELLQEPETLQFPGRLSAVLPRYADPALKDNLAILHKTNEQQVPAAQVEVEQNELVQQSTEVTEEAPPVNNEQFDEDGDSVMSDSNEPQARPEEVSVKPPVSLMPSHSPSKQMLGTLGLHEKDTDPYHGLDSESDDELAYSGRRQNPSDSYSAVPATPTPAAPSRRSLGQPRVSKVGFTPLAKQLSTWAAGSPAKGSKGSAGQTPAVQESPAKSSFFDDEMSVRVEAETQGEVEAAVESDIMADIEDPEFNDTLVTNEDTQLAAEADEMSLMEPEQAEEAAHGMNAPDDVSEASQEYGDENDIPVDPAMMQDSNQAGVSVPPTTPLRVLSREFHTVSKVPLKGAHESTARPRKKKRAASISRLPVSRPTRSLSRSATVISYSPAKGKKSSPKPSEREDDRETTQHSVPTTPSRAETWSTMGTPARTPRRDVNPALLSGAVVFVDVHTSEGADASGIFVDLLNQMGARCVKNWSWNPDSSTDSPSSKIGITHVVHKDGGKRTMEKVRESGGVVQCVGVSWVLDCERENEWLDEAPYYIDTSLLPRGGARRRKSMEPKALANLDGMLISSPAKGAAREGQRAPNTPMSRRDSTVWMHTPSDQAEDEQDGQDWQLTPVPVTPAPEALARYAADVTPETPTAALGWDVGVEGQEEYSPSKKAALLMTCPPKPTGQFEMGHGILDREKDEQVMKRLMAVRRKSLQFAPKIGSPLARAWK